MVNLFAATDRAEVECKNIVSQHGHGFAQSPEPLFWLLRLVCSLRAAIGEICDSDPRRFGHGPAPTPFSRDVGSVQAGSMTF